MDTATTTRRVCRGCGCTDNDACIVSYTRSDGEEPLLTTCHWVESDRCSACALPGLTREYGPRRDHRTVADTTNN